MTPSTTSHRAEFVVGLRYEDLPAAVVERVKRQCLDLVDVRQLTDVLRVDTTTRRSAASRGDG